MDDSAKKTAQNRSFYVLVCAVYLGCLLFAILVKRSWYADGAEFFRSVLNRQYDALFPVANDANVLRPGINFLNQLPLILGLRLGISNITVLQILFAVPLFFQAVCGFALCAYTADPKDRPLLVFPLASYAFFGMLSEIFILNQAFAASWVYWILFFLFLKQEKLTGIGRFLCLLLCLAVLPVSHETVMPAGAVMIAACLFECVIRKNRANLAVKAVILADLVFAVVFNYIFLRTHASSTGSSYFALLKDVLKSGSFLSSNLMISLAGALLILVFAWISFPAWAAFAAGVLGGVFCVFVFVTGRSDPNLEYTFRSFVTIGTVLMLVLAYGYRILPEKWTGRIRLRSWVNVTAAVLLVQSFWQTGNSVGWQAYLSDFDRQLSGAEGFEVPGQENKYEWAWTQPDLSILESETPYVIDRLILPADNRYGVTCDGENLVIPCSAVNPRVFDFAPLSAAGTIEPVTKEAMKDGRLSFSTVSDPADASDGTAVCLAVETDGTVFQNASAYRFTGHLYDENGTETAIEELGPQIRLFRDGDVLVLPLPKTWKTGPKMTVRLSLESPYAEAVTDADGILPAVTAGAE